ncbi:hypothetical protein HK102_002987 [Quaeritorhiza haematococci]|nr:hypothetical protein HK102_002987 [Quaeritorhiza haematococci]
MDFNELFSAVDVGVSPFVKSVLTSSDHQSGGLAGVLQSAILPPGLTFPAPWSTLSTAFGVGLEGVGVKSGTEKSLDVDVRGLRFGLPFPVDVDIGYLAARAGLDNAPLLEFTVPGGGAAGAGGIRIAAPTNPPVTGLVGNKLDVSSRVSFKVETSVAASRVAFLANRFLQGSTEPTGVTANVAGISMGVSSTDRIKALEKIMMRLPLDSFLTFDQGFNVDELLGGFVSRLVGGGAGGSGATEDFTLQRAGFAVLPRKTMSAKATALVSLPLPFALTLDLGYVGIGFVGIDGVPTVTMQIQPVSYAVSAPRALNFAATLRFVDTDNVAGTLKRIVDTYISSRTISGSLGVGQIEFGHFVGDAIQSFRQVQVSLGLNSLLKPIADWAMGLIDTFISTIPRDALQKSTDGTNGLEIRLNTNGMGLTIRQAKVDFQPQSVIMADVEAVISVPGLRVSADVPYVGLEVGLDGTPGMGIQVTGFRVVGASSNALSLRTVIQVKDSEDLADRIAAIADAFLRKKALPGDLRISGLTLGAGTAGSGSSEVDTIKAFSKIEVPMGLNRVAAPFVGNLTVGVDAVKLLKEFGFRLGDVGIKGLPQRSLMARIGASFRNSFPVSMNLPFAGTNLGLNDSTLLSANVGGLSFSTGANSLILDALCKFPPFPNDPSSSLEETKSKIAAFVASVMKNGFGRTTEVLTVTGLRFGYSDRDYIRAFSKARIGIPSSALLTQALVDFLLEQIGLIEGPGNGNGTNTLISSSGFNIPELLSRLQIQSAEVDGTHPGKLVINPRVSIVRMPLRVTLDLPYVGATFLIAGEMAARLSMSGLALRPVPGQQAVGVELRLEVVFGEGEGLKRRVAQIIRNMQDNKVGGVFSGITFGLTGMQFGASSSDRIDALEKVVVDGLNAEVVTQPATGVFDNMLNSMRLQLIRMGATGSSTLKMDIAAHMVIPIPNINLKMPFIRMRADFDGRPFLVGTISNMTFRGDQALCGMEIEFGDDLGVAQQVALIVSDILFRRPKPFNNRVTVNGLIFGSSEASAIKMAEYGIIDLGLNTIMSQAADYVLTPGNEVAMQDMYTSMTPTGLEMKIRGKPLPPGLPFASFPGASGIVRVSWGPDWGMEQRVLNAYVSNIVFEPGKPFSCDISIDSEFPGFATAFKDALPRLLKWQNYVENVYMGAIEFTVGDPRNPQVRFTRLNQIRFLVPELYMYRPLFVRPKLVNPFTQGLGMDINIGFRNPGVLHIDLGKLGVSLTNRDRELFRAYSRDEIVIRNVNEGGNDPANNTIVMQARARLDPLHFWQNLWDLMQGAKQYELKFFTEKAGVGDLTWLTRLLNGIPNSIKEELVPIILSLLRNVKLQFGPITIPFQERFLAAADERLALLSSNSVVFLKEE